MRLPTVMSHCQTVRHTKHKGNYSISYQDAPADPSPVYHIHNQFEVILCLSDHMFCDFGGKRVDISADTLLLFNNRELHMYGSERKDAQDRHYVMYLDPFYLKDISTDDTCLLECFLRHSYDDSCYMKLTREQSEKIRQMMDGILELKEKNTEKGYGREMRDQLAIAELMLEINLYYRQYHNMWEVSYEKQYMRMYEIAEYISIHHSEEMSLDILSEEFKLDKVTLCKYFRQVTGVTPNQYLIKIRLEHAKELLIRGKSVGTASDKTGFKSLCHFSRTFSGWTGISPKQFQISFRPAEELLEDQDTEK